MRAKGYIILKREARVKTFVRWLVVVVQCSSMCGAHKPTLCCVVLCYLFIREGTLTFSLTLLIEPNEFWKIFQIGPGVLACATRGGGRSEAGHCFHLLFSFFFFFLLFSPTPSAFHPLRGISRA